MQSGIRRCKPALLAVSITLCSLVLQGAEARRAEILWDTYGIPHIFARTNEDLLRAYGWAQMASHGDLVLRLYGQARGRAAEYWGEPYVTSDRWVRTNGVPERGRLWAEAQKQPFRSYVEAFASGMNQYARENPNKLAPEGKMVLPVTAADVMAHVIRVIYYNFMTSEQAVAAATTSRIVPGSNAWAISPRRTADRHAMLLANPHLPWSDLFLLYECQFSGPGIDSYGASLVGFPVQGIAFNDRLGWSHTVNTNDSADLYELTPSGDGYLWDGTTKAFDTTTDTLAVKQGGGAARNERLVIRRSVHGPVVGERNGRPVALRIAGLDQPGLCEEWWEMARAKNLKEFGAALHKLQIPMFTVIYADRDGHIMHLFNAIVPMRPAGNYNWAGVVPGDTSKTLWTKTHPYEDLPRVVDPPSGWLQNANDPPWTTTFPQVLDPDKFPPYMAPQFMTFRAQRSARMLDDDSKMTFTKLIEDTHSTHMELADRILDDLLEAAGRKGGENLAKAAAVLEKWDRCADAGSRGTVLFDSFVRHWAQRGQQHFAVPWKQNDPRHTPKGIADTDKAVAALESAAEETQQRWGSIDVAWGDINRLRGGDLDLLGNGGPGDRMGIFHVINYAPAKDGKFQAMGGDSYIATVEFSQPVRAMALIGYGNSTQPGSPHLTDQLPFVSRKELRPVWRSYKEVEAHLEARKVFGR